MKKWRFEVLTILFVLFLLVGCSQLTPPTPTSSVTPAASPLPLATATPTPIPGVLMLVGQVKDETTKAVVKSQAESAGLTLDERSDLLPEDLKPEVKIVVLLEAPANLNDLLAAAPQTQFVLLTTADAEAAANLSVIRMRAEDQAFVAGYVATVITDNWRSGGLIASEATSIQDAFANGGRYFCGDCAPGWPLKVYYPVVGSADAPADGAAWVATAQTLFDTDKVDVFYLSSEASQPDVINFLAGRNQLDHALIVVGAVPPPDALRAQWAATVQLDPQEALKEVLPQVLAGKSAGKVNVPVTLTNVNTQLLSEGRLKQAQLMMADLASGMLVPQSVPAQ
jgi:hypothetical protein